MRLTIILTSLFLFLGVGGVAGEPAPAGGELILDQCSYWRFFMAANPSPAIQTKGGLEKGDPAWAKGLVPDGWAGAEFDDRAWGLSPGPFFGPSGNYGFTRVWWRDYACSTLGLLCLRGKFEVTRPADMNLRLEYRGGVAVYVNGKEVARQDLPKGAIEPGMVADPYPREAFANEKGEMLKEEDVDHNATARANNLEKRIRRLSATIPASAFRAGLNVLAIEVHRAPYDEACLVGPKRVFYGEAWNRVWSTAGLSVLELRAPAGAAVSNAARPKGLQVWSANPLRGVYDADYAPPGENPGPIELVAARNGAFSGQVVVGCDTPIKGLKGVMGDLKSAQGDGVIPASAVEVRYAGFSPEKGGGGGDITSHRYRGLGVERFDALLEAPPEEVSVWRHYDHGQLTDADKARRGAVQPVWVTVNVPADAKPGEYAGTLTLKASGQQDVAVPVKVTVHGYKLPDPKSYVTFVDFIPSPETVALWYKVPPYSDEHFKLMEKTWKQLGRVGEKVIWLELVARSNNGNSQTMVRWIKQPDGSCKYDFSVLDRYLDMAQKYVDPKYVVLYVYEGSNGCVGWDGKRFARKDEYFDKVCVTELDPATGKAKEGWLTGPTYWDEEAAEKFWRPVLEEVRERLKKRGLYDRVLWGEGFEAFTAPCAARVLKKVLPEVRGWSLSGHNARYAVGDSPVLLNEHVYGHEGGSKFGWDPCAKRKNWDEVNYDRQAWSSHPLACNRLLAESSMKMRDQFGNFIGHKGFGRIGADFWPLGLKGPESRGLVANRYPESIRIAREITSGWLAPGPDGAVATVRFEMCREGIEELEARIFIEQNVLADAGGRAKVGEELAKRCEEAFAERDKARQSPLMEGAVSVSIWYPASGWQERSGKLFALAAEVAGKLGK